MQEPGDPSQVEDELGMLVYGIMASDVWSCVEQQVKGCIVRKKFGVFATTVLNHMLAPRACKYLMVHVVMLAFLLSDLLFMLQEAEANATQMHTVQHRRYLGGGCLC